MTTISFNTPGTAKPITDRDELWDTFTALLDQGWGGSIGLKQLNPGSADPASEYRLDVQRLNAVTLTPETMTATIGDMRVTQGSVVTVMTAELFAALHPQTDDA